MSTTGAGVGVESGAEGVVRPPVPSFEEVYAAHFDFVWRSARAMGVPSASVDDVVQDVFMVVHRRLSEFEGRAQLRTWLARILVRVICEHRRRFRRKEAHAPLEEEPVDRGQLGPLEQVARREAARALLAILDAMDDEKRQVFVLAEVEQLPVPEIATALGINVNTAYSRLRLARAEYEKQLSRLRARDEWRLP